MSKIEILDDDINEQVERKKNGDDDDKDEESEEEDAEDEDEEEEEEEDDDSDEEDSELDEDEDEDKDENFVEWMKNKVTSWSQYQKTKSTMKSILYGTKWAKQKLSNVLWIVSTSAVVVGLPMLMTVVRDVEYEASQYASLLNTAGQPLSEFPKAPIANANVSTLATTTSSSSSSSSSSRH